VNALGSKELQTLILPVFRSGAFAQAALLSSDSACLRQGPLAPSGFPDLLATLGLSDSRVQRSSRLLFPASTLVGTTCCGGDPRFLDHSFDARSPLSPRNVPRLHSLVASSQIIDFIISGRLVTFTLRNEADSGLRLAALGLASSRSQGYLPCSPSPCGGDRPAPSVRLPLQWRPSLHAKQAISMDRPFHLSRVARLRLAHQNTQNTQIKIRLSSSAISSP
jgi:hypothetical protein